MNKSADAFCGKCVEDQTSGVRLLLFAFVSAVSAGLLYIALNNLVSFLGVLAYGPIRGPAGSDYYSHILLIPFVSAYFLFEIRNRVRQLARYSPYGVAIMAAGLIIFAVSLWQRGWLGDNDFASTATAGAIIFWWGGFLLSFGPAAFQAACFPLLFMLFMIPIPQYLLEGLIHILQVGSTEVTQWLFELTGTNYIRDGFIYQLTGINIEVAKECSSIRSSIALIITGVVAGHLFLRSGWKVLLLLVAMLPINLVKNAIRITTLSLLAIYVDRKFITDSFLHHSGGFLFYLPALGMMALMVMWLRKGETKKKEGAERGDANLPQMGTDER
jgi:exosortase